MAVDFYASSLDPLEGHNVPKPLKKWSYATAFPIDQVLHEPECHQRLGDLSVSSEPPNDHSKARFTITQHLQKSSLYIWYSHPGLKSTLWFPVQPLRSVAWKLCSLYRTPGFAYASNYAVHGDIDARDRVLSTIEKIHRERRIQIRKREISIDGKATSMSKMGLFSSVSCQRKQG